MTAAEEEPDNRNETEVNDSKIIVPLATNLQPEIHEIFHFLVNNRRIVFKSQQIDDPELNQSEKIEIAHEIYARNRQTFLMRFGNYFEERHLSNFENLAISADSATPPLKNDENYDEILLLIKELRSKLQTRRRDVKNRRYAAMQKLIADGEYFSEQEMIKRAPELYQELIGQYLSDAEKKRRDGYDVRNTSFAGILMHQMEQREVEDVLKQADRNNRNVDKEVERIQERNIEAAESNASQTLENETDETVSTISTSIIRHDDEFDDVPSGFRQQWGNFEDEIIACSTSRPIKPKPKTKNGQNNDLTEPLITAGERDLLRQEFIDIMHEQFLSGNDKDFDYTTIDDDTQLDDLKQLNQDREDAYFANSDDNDDDDDDDDGVNDDNRQSEDNNAFLPFALRRRRSDVKAEEDNEEDSSADELDIYMKHLSKHHSLQN